VLELDASVAPDVVCVDGGVDSGEGALVVPVVGDNVVDVEGAAVGTAGEFAFGGVSTGFASLALVSGVAVEGTGETVGVTFDTAVVDGAAGALVSVAGLAGSVAAIVCANEGLAIAISTAILSTEGIAISSIKPRLMRRGVVGLADVANKCARGWGRGFLLEKSTRTPGQNFRAILLISLVRVKRTSLGRRLGLNQA
jgi:hypothetical protein